MASDENFENLIAEIDAEEKGTTNKKEVTKSSVDKNGKEEDGKMTFAHEEIMKEEGLTKNDLPSDVRSMVITFERKMRMAKAKKASEKTFLKIQNLSTLIGDKILDYIETKDESFEDGGVLDDGADAGFDAGDDAGADAGDDTGDDLSLEGNTDVEDDMNEDDFDDGGSVKTKKKGSIFGDILGGIFDY